MNKALLSKPLGGKQITYIHTNSLKSCCAMEEEARKDLLRFFCSFYVQIIFRQIPLLFIVKQFVVKRLRD